jgi:hypothetical protein
LRTYRRRYSGRLRAKVVGAGRYGAGVTSIGIFEFSAPLWLHPGADAWHFVSVPPEVSDDITDLSAGFRRGFGSVRVSVTVGATSWRTSVFPDSKQGTYLLPMKKEVRKAEKLVVGDTVHTRLELVDL